MSLDGRIERPKLAIRLARPSEALGLTDVLLNLDPTPAGFAYRAAGGSHLGPFTSNGAILLPKGQPALIQVAAINVSNTRASGALRSDPGGFTGRLDVDGGGLAGRLAVQPVQQPPAHRHRPQGRQCALRRSAADRDPKRPAGRRRPARSGRHLAQGNA